MERNAKWDAFVANYFKMSRALQLSKFTEVELFQKCRDLKAQLVEKSLQMQVAQAVKIDDDITIEALRSDMAKAVARADLALAREVATKTLVADLQQEIENLKTRLTSDVVQQSEETSTAASPLERPRGTSRGRGAPKLLRPAHHATDALEDSEIPNNPSSFAQWKAAKNMPYGRR